MRPGSLGPLVGGITSWHRCLFLDSFAMHAHYHAIQCFVLAHYSVVNEVSCICGSIGDPSNPGIARGVYARVNSNGEYPVAEFGEVLIANTKNINCLPQSSCSSLTICVNTVLNWRCMCSMVPFTCGCQAVLMASIVPRLAKMSRQNSQLNLSSRSLRIFSGRPHHGYTSRM